MSDLTCKTCRHLLSVRKHPWNREPTVSEGPISDRMGWCCSVMKSDGFVVFFDKVGIGCEMHTPLEAERPVRTGPSMLPTPSR